MNKSQRAKFIINALNEAYYKGVEIIPIKVCWEKNGECYYNGIIPFHN